MICSTFVKKKNPTTRVSNELGLKSENARCLQALLINLAQTNFLGAKWDTQIYIGWSSYIIVGILAIYIQDVAGI